MIELDTQLFLYLNRLFSGSAATLFFSAVTHLGNGLVTAAVILIPMYFKDRRNFRRHALPMVVAVALSGAAVNLIKPAVNRPRPPDYFAALDVSVHTPLGTPSDKSFPSGHTQTAFGAATYLSCIYPAAAPIFLLAAGLTGLSRIAIGVHFPSDVLTGALFGILFSLIGYRIARRRLKTHSPLKCVVLFDIDGTLVTGPRNSAGARAMNAASIDITGKPARFHGADYAGRTDRQIARMLVEDAQESPAEPEQISAFLAAYLRHLSALAVQAPYAPIGDPRAAIVALRRRGARVGLGTGNLRTGAATKLKSAGLDDLFTPLFGGFGDDGEHRAALLEAGARTLNPKRDLPVIVVGDTPHDVEGARAVGARCIGHPFGRHDGDALRSAGADTVVQTLDASLAETVAELL